MTTYIFVLGMHRSGTSVVAGSLMLLGVTGPTELMPANAFNPKGHFEPERIVVANEALLAAAGSSWDDLRDVPAAIAMPDEAKVAECARVLSDAFPPTPLAVLKDPRISRLLPIWLAAARQLGGEAKFLIVLRQPWGTASSLQHRDGFDTDRSLALWMRHMLEAERLTRGYPRVILPVEAFVADPAETLAQAGATLGIAWPHPPERRAAELRAFVEHDLLRNAPRPATALAGLATDVHDLLFRLSQDPADLDAISRLDHLASGCDAVTSLLVRIENDQKRSAEVEERFLSNTLALEAMIRILEDEVTAQRLSPLRLLRDKVLHGLLSRLGRLPLLPATQYRRWAASAAKRDPDRAALSGKSQRRG